MHIFQKTKYFLYSTLPLVVGFFLAPHLALGDQGGPTGNAPIGITNPIINATDLFGLLKLITQIVGQIGIYVAVIMIIYSGFKFVKAQGNPGEIEAAKKMLMYTLIGTAVLLGAWLLASVVQGTINQFKG